MNLRIVLFSLFFFTFASVCTTEHIPDEVFYCLSTRENVNNSTGEIFSGKNIINQLEASSFDPSKRIFFIIHGWLDNYSSEINTLLKTQLLSKYDANAFVVDWNIVANNTYLSAATGVHSIGQIVGFFINNLITHYELDGSQFTLIGFSMGAHVAGIAGSLVKKNIKHIIGLDPAGPFFKNQQEADRLDKEDADYVQIIHTSTSFIGYPVSLGHADYYPNGGRSQAGCHQEIVCSHTRAFRLLAEAISGDEFKATQCSAYFKYRLFLCSFNKKALMGLIDPDATVFGDYFLDTNDQLPFARD